MLMVGRARLYVKKIEDKMKTILLAFICMISSQTAFASEIPLHEEKTVKGDSLYPIIKEGQTVKFLHDYYETKRIERNDIVLIKYGGNDHPLIKIIKGIPGDKIVLLNIESKQEWFSFYPQFFLHKVRR